LQLSRNSISQLKASIKSSLTPRKPYKYTQLPNDRAIRLLHLLPGKTEDPIICELHLASLDDIARLESHSEEFEVPVDYSKVPDGETESHDSDVESQSMDERSDFLRYEALSYVWGSPIEKISHRMLWQKTDGRCQPVQRAKGPAAGRKEAHSLGRCTMHQSR
jgi:hypothetical protein